MEVSVKRTGRFLNGRRILFVVAILVAATLLAAFARGRKKDPVYFTAAIEKGDIRSEVTATGTINAVTTVQVGSQISGTILRLFADFNSRVRRGQVVAQIDPATYRARVEQAQADMETAQANVKSIAASIETSRADVASSKANVDKARAQLSQAKIDLERTTELFEQKIVAAAVQIGRASCRERV